MYYRLGGGNIIEYANTYLRKCKIKIIGKGNKILFQGTNYFKNCTFCISGNNCNIIIGDKVCGYYCKFIIEDPNGVISVGEKSLFTGCIEIACTEGGKIEIGENNLFSSEIDIRNGDSHSIFDANGNRVNYARNISIGNHNWFGHKCMLLKGCVIKDDSVIGAGSVVTKVFNSSNIVIAGFPAKIVKDNIYWDHER